MNIQTLHKIEESIYTIIMNGKHLADNDYMKMLYYKIFGTMPSEIRFFDKERVIDWYQKQNDDYEPFRNELNKKQLHDELINKYSAYYTCVNYNDTYVLYEKNMICMIQQKVVAVYGMDDVDAVDSFVKEIQSIMDFAEENESVAEVGILTSLGNGYYVDYHEIPKKTYDIDKIYNDDLPAEEIDKFIESDETGLLLFYGEPGTGKTSYIRHLIGKHQDTDFIVLDSNILCDITSNALLKEFIDNEDAVWILEDCEKLLVSRDDMPNPIMSAFLNMSDGILASIIKCKFICTFNTNIENVDKALLRKGRMKLKYEFKKLAKEKAQQICEDVTADITIADLFYMNKENDFSKKNRKKIGF